MNGILFFLTLVGISSQAAVAVKAELTPRKISGGEVALIRLSAPKGAALPADLAVMGGEIPIPLFECPKQKEARCGLVSTPLEAKTTFPVALKWTEGEAAKTESLALAITEKKYPKTKLKVAPSQTSPSPEDQKKIDKDREDFKAMYSTPNPTPFWDADFLMPVKGTVTSAFGSQRVFNGEVKTVHYGVDIRAGLKTPILCANAGKVIFAREAFFGGNMVVIDHGMGLYSSYNHLSVIGVTLGQSLKRGEKIGMAGATGRVTGPHLHWGIRVNGLAVDPYQFKKVFNGMWKAEGVKISSSRSPAR